MFGQAFTFVWLGRLDAAETMADRANVLFAQSENERGSRGIMALRAFVLWMRGDLRGGAELFLEIIESSRRVGDEGDELIYMLALSGIMIRVGRHSDAASVQLHAMGRFLELSDDGGVIHALDWMAHALTNLDKEEGLLLASSVDALKERTGAIIDLTKLGLVEPRTTAAETLPEHTIEALWLRGREIGLEQTVALAQKLGDEQNIIPAPVDIDFVRQ